MGNTKDFSIFAATIAGEAISDREVSWKVVAHVIINRVGFREWKNYKTPTAVITRNGEKRSHFDAYGFKTHHYQSAYKQIKSEQYTQTKVKKLVEVVKPIYDDLIPDPTGKVVMYFSPKAQSSVYGYKPRWNFKILEEVTVQETINAGDDFKWYRYKGDGKGTGIQIELSDKSGEKISAVPYCIDIEGKTMLEGVTNDEGVTTALCGIFPKSQ